MTAAILDPKAEWRTWPVEDKTRLRWRLASRPKQRPPEGDWSTWLILAGRGWGKTRTGAEWLAGEAWRNAGSRWAVVAPTYADARDTCIEGESGLLAALAGTVENWNRSLGEVVLRNGSRIKLFSADEPERLRGPQHHGAWCDELASWRYPEAWDQLMFGLRLGQKPRTVVTTTPRPTKLVRTLRARDGSDVTLTVGSTFENAANLAPAAVAELRSRYENTRLGRQELYAEILTDVPGALWTLALIDDHRIETTPELVRVTTAIDPAVTSDEDSDETGIVVAARGVDGDCYVLDDRSCRLSPDRWARRAIGAHDDHEGDRIVAETNNGGDLVEMTLRAVEPSVPYKKVTASRGKRVRAEPIAALYEQGRVHHVGTFGELEEQLISWTPDSGESPDRLDALVWAVSDLMLEPERRRSRFRGAA